MITHPDKVLFPDGGITKGELAAYYEAVAPVMLPHITGRPITMERYPAGIGKKGFWQKDVSKGFPEWLERVKVPKKDGVVHHPVITDERSLLWVTNQNTRWGSCTPADKAIRLSRRLEGMPPWVIDYVLVHELAHLIEIGHTPRFWELVDRYPRAERAKGFLEGVAAASQLGITADSPDCSPEGAAAMAADDVD